MYKLHLSKRALKDLELLKRTGLSKKAIELREILRINPFQNPPPYEKIYDMANNMYSRRINIQHRLVYQVFTAEKTVLIHRMWSHYE